MDNLVIKNLETTDEMNLAFPLVKQFYPHIDLKRYNFLVSEMVELNNFKMIGLWLKNKLVGVCGYYVASMFYCGRYLQISNFIIDENYRNQGIGSYLMMHLEKLAKELGCQKFVLDSYTENKKSHSLYFRQGFYIRGFHFMKDLDDN